MFQKGTGKWLKLLAIGMIGWGCALAFGAKTVELDHEALLADVEIDDLLTSRRSKTDSTSENEKEQVKSIISEGSNEVIQREGVAEFKLDESMVLAEIKHQIASHFQITDDFRFFLDKPWSEITLNNPAWEIVITSFPAQGLRSRFFVNFELWSDGRRIASYQEGVRCELWKDAYVAQRQIDRGTVMNEGYVTIQPVDMLSLYQSPVDIGTALSDYVIVNTVKQGQPICQRDLRERPLIEKNDIIDVVAQEGFMRVTLKGKALEEGIKGQFIRVRNLQSGSDIQAEVIGINQAKVYF